MKTNRMVSLGAVRSKSRRSRDVKGDVTDSKSTTVSGDSHKGQRKSLDVTIIEKGDFDIVNKRSAIADRESGGRRGPRSATGMSESRI
jgi:hypothetical protein